MPDMARLSSFNSVEFARGLTQWLGAPAGNNNMAVLRSVSLVSSGRNGSRPGLIAGGMAELAPDVFSTSLERRSGSHVQASIAAGGGLPLLVNVDPNNLQGPRLVPAFGEPASLTFLGLGLLASARFLRKKRRGLGA
jgi:hypothetical protein